MKSATFYYQSGDQFKVRFRKHYCYKCGKELSVIKHSKFVHSKEENAKYYDFTTSSGSSYVPRSRAHGMCEFIHKIFFCMKCIKPIEFVTQINQEDIDIIISKTQKYFLKRGRTVNIEKLFETQNNELVDRCIIDETVKNLVLKIKDEDEGYMIYNVPISRRDKYERPYYFDLKKRKLIKFIKPKE